MSSNFGFNVDDVFGNARKGRKTTRKTKKKKDSMDNMMEGSFGGSGGMGDGGFGGGLGIDSFSLAEPKIDALGFGGDFGEQIGARAGRANGKGGGFLDIIGQQQSRIAGASVTGKGRIARGRGRKSTLRSRGRTPLQRSTGTRFGEVDRKFAGNVIGNIRGAKRRIGVARKKLSEFRERRRKSKTVSTRDTPQLAFQQPALRSAERPALMENIPSALEGNSPPALEDKSRSSQ